MKKIIQNRDITYSEVRIVEGSSNIVLPIASAMLRANAQGMDLVLINDRAEPPICHILDGSKYKYDQAIRYKQLAKKQRASHIKIKEMQFKLNISPHDFETKCRNISKFLAKGNLVKVQVQFKGREQSNSAPGFALITRVVDSLTNAEIDSIPQFSGNRITTILKGTKNETTTT